MLEKALSLDLASLQDSTYGLEGTPRLVAGCGLARGTTGLGAPGSGG